MQFIDVMSRFQTYYVSWSKSGEEKIALELKIENTDLKIILNRGCLVYPIPNSPTPVVLENSVNIASEDTRIKNIFEEALVKSGRLFHFENDSDRKFELRFFPNELSINKKLEEENKENKELEKPRWGLKYECVIL